jgi:hypothetical protein
MPHISLIARVTNVEEKNGKIVAYLTDGPDQEPVPLDCTACPSSSTLLRAGAELVIFGCRTSAAQSTDADAHEEGSRQQVQRALELKPTGEVLTLDDAMSRNLVPPSFDRTWTGKPKIPKQAPTFIKISALEPDMKAQNLIGRVVKVSLNVRPTAAGPKMTVANVVLADETACINFVTRSAPYVGADPPDGDPTTLLKEGQTFVFFNTRVVMRTLPDHRDVGHMELVADKWSTIRPLSALDPGILPPDADVTCVASNNMSDVEFVQKDDDGGAKEAGNA